MPYADAYRNPASRDAYAYTMHSSVGRALSDSDTLIRFFGQLPAM